ncbi:hypothetical protein Avbf_12517 [Armadillidium vulgare]|nr:hypothetical protein Avbf_12517 [Armadillidium vulgare]
MIFYAIKIKYLPDSLFDNQKVVLEFEGLDTACEIVLQDTTELGRTENMFSRYLIDITDQEEG